MDSKIRYKDLSLPLKIGFILILISSILIILNYLLLFIVGFLTGFWSSV